MATFTWPPLLTMVPDAMAPDEADSSPPLLTIVPLTALEAPMRFHRVPVDRTVPTICAPLFTDSATPDDT